MTESALGARKRKRRPLPTWKRVAFTLAFCLIVFLALELFCRVLEIWRPPVPVDIGAGFTSESKLFEKSQSGPMQTKIRKRPYFCPETFSEPKPEDTFRVFALGGSSVNYVQPEFDAIEKESAKTTRRLEIINCGGLSYGSQRLVLIAREVLTYSPDLVLIYSGHNEFEEVEQLELAALSTTKQQSLLASSAFVRLLQSLIQAGMVAKLEKEHNERILQQDQPDYARAWRVQFTTEDVNRRMDAYTSNLQMIVDMCKEKHVPVVICTVPSNMVRPYLPKAAWQNYRQVSELIKQKKYDEAYSKGEEILAATVGRHQASELENAIIRKLAKKNNIPLLDVKQAIITAEPNGIPGETLFKDHCHLNDKGNHILAELLLQYLAKWQK